MPTAGPHTLGDTKLVVMDEYSMPWQQKYACLGLGLDIGATLFGSVITEYFPWFGKIFRIVQ